MYWQTAGILILAYLIGSFPTAYLVGKRRRIDIRRVGSGTGGAANVWRNVSRRWGAAVALIDFGKGLLAVLIAMMVDAAIAVQWAAGLAAITGHNWSAFRKLRGGRGIMTAAGALSLLAPVQVAIAAGLGLLVAAVLSLPVGALLAVAGLPLILLVSSKAPVAIWSSVAILVLVVAKRLLPDHGLRAATGDGARVFGYRLLLDRDVRDRDAWVHRLSDATAVDRQDSR